MRSFASNVVIAATTEIVPPPSFTTNALALGHINTDRNNTDKDADGILRRAKAFDIHQKWHFAFQKVEDDAEDGVDLSQDESNPTASFCLFKWRKHCRASRQRWQF